jgi:hypothetical protein
MKEIRKFDPDLEAHRARRAPRPDSSSPPGSIELAQQRIFAEAERLAEAAYLDYAARSGVIPPYLTLRPSWQR